MEDSAIPVLLITANVGSIFEDVSNCVEKLTSF